MSGRQRQGFVFPTLLLAVGAAGLLVVGIVAAASQRATAGRLHGAQIQGREWCLGVRQLPPGTSLAQGPWRIVHGADGQVTAQGPLGRYTIFADGREGWQRRGEDGP